MIPDHPRHVQVFDYDRLVFANEPSRELVEIVPPRRCLSMDACYEVARPGTNCYEPYEALQERLGAAGLYNQDCTIWYSAIYE